MPQNIYNNNIAIQINQKELTKPFMIILFEKTFGLHG